MSPGRAPLAEVTISTLVVLGGSGDLANRLLMPALGKLLDAEPHRRGLVLLGAGAEALDDQSGKDQGEASLRSAQVSGETIEALLAATSYQQADGTKPQDLTRRIRTPPPAAAGYFALPPAVTARACDALSEVNLPMGTVLVLEKPFGVDEDSAKALNTRLARLVPEERTFRV